MAALSPRTLAAALAGLLMLGGCSAYDDGYGYSSVSLGYGTGYYDPWYYDRYGWYDGFYYPGRGYYIYDRHGRRHRWSDHHRRYWESRKHDRRDWRDGDRDHDGRADRRREWRRDRDGDGGSGYWRRDRDGDRGSGHWRRDDRPRSREWGGRRENLTNPGRPRPESGAVRPSPRSERGTLGPALKGRSDRSLSPRDLRRDD